MHASTSIFSNLAVLTVVGGLLFGIPTNSPTTLLPPKAIVNRTQFVSLVPASERPGGRARFAGAQSTNWAGWVDTGASYRSVTASWRQPRVSCSVHETSYSSFWVGLDGDGSSTVEQTGTAADCRNGAPTYSAWYEFFPAYPRDFGNAVRAGDVMHASVAHLGATSSYTVTLTDSTAGWSHTITASVPAARNASAEVIAEAPAGTGGQILPLAHFSPITFSATMVNGAALGAVAAASSLTMVSAGRARAIPSALSGQTSFAVTWQNS
jgi:Peptidase A4 family